MLNSKRGIDGSLVTIRRGTGEIVEIEPQKETVLVGEVVVQPDGELVRIRDHHVRSRIGMHSIRAAWEIGQRIACQNFGDPGVHRHDQRIAGVGGGVYSLAFLCYGDRKDLGGAKHLAKALIVSEVKRPFLGRRIPWATSEDEHRLMLGVDAPKSRH